MRATEAAVMCFLCADEGRAVLGRLLVPAPSDGDEEAAWYPCCVAHAREMYVRDLKEGIPLEERLPVCVLPIPSSIKVPKMDSIDLVFCRTSQLDPKTYLQKNCNHSGTPCSWCMSKTP